MNHDTHITRELIIDRVASYYNIEPHELCGHTRSLRFCRPRHVATYLIRKLLGLSLVESGYAIGQRDHTTAMNAIKRVQGMLRTDAEFQSQLDYLIADLSMHDATLSI